MEPKTRTKKPTTGIRKRGSFARKETVRGAKQSRKRGSTRPLGWFRTKRIGPSAGMCSAPAISILRKKTRRTRRIIAVVRERTAFRILDFGFWIEQPALLIQNPKSKISLRQKARSLPRAQ